MLFKNSLLLLFLSSLTMATSAQTFVGSWRVALETPGGELPFYLEIYEEGAILMAALLLILVSKRKRSSFILQSFIPR
jgi:hypothetical protein